MVPKSHWLNNVLNEAIIALLVLAFVAPSLAAKERKGAGVVVTKLDKQVIRGELLAVKGNDLTILDRATATEVTTSLFEIRSIEIDSRAQGAALIIGAIGFGVLGATYGAEHGQGGPVLLGGLGVITGGLMGSFVAGLSSVISINLLDEGSLQKIRVRLKKRARYRN